MLSHFTKAILAAAILISSSNLLAQPACNDTVKDENLHSIYIDRLGRLTDLNGVIIHELAENDYVKKITENIKNELSKNDNLKLTIYIHGGLNSFEHARSRPSRFTPGMLCDGHYPIFISWNSGFPTNYIDHLFRIRKGEHSPLKGIITFPFIFLEDVGRSIVRIPPAIYKELETPFKVAIWRYTKEERFADQRLAALDNTEIVVRNDEPKRGVGKSYWNFLNPLKFVTAPFADGFGTGAWNAMLRRTDHVLAKQLVFEGDVHPKEPNSRTKTAAAQFFDIIVSDKSLRLMDKNLIGHSMGTIIANNILIKYPDIKLNNVVYMGAAASIKDVQAAVVPWMQQPNNAKAQFYNLSLDPYRELSESHGFDSVPRGSLLNWIDYIYGDVNSFNDRTAGSWWNIIRMAQEAFPETIHERIHLTRFPIGDSAMGPQLHGDFGDYCFWQEKFWSAQKPFVKHSDEWPTCH